MANYISLDYGIRQSILDSGAPTSGTWAVGDLVWSSAPAVGSPVGWICTTAGTPGTWTAWSVLPVSANGVTTTAVAANVAANVNILTTTGTTYNVTFALPTVNNTNLYVVNLASGTITVVAATGAAIVGLVTVPTATSGSFRSNSTNWYRVD